MEEACQECFAEWRVNGLQRRGTDLESHDGRNVLDKPRDGEDHAGGVAVLFDLAVNLRKGRSQTPSARVRIATSRQRVCGSPGEFGRR